MLLPTLLLLSVPTDPPSEPATPSPPPGLWEFGPTSYVQEADEPPPPGGIQDFWDAMAGGKAYLRFRYRYEFVEDKAFTKDAHASTLQTVLGYETDKWKKWSGKVEFTDVTPIGNDLYNSTKNGRTDRPIVPDSDTTALTQFFIRWEGIKNTETHVGRRIINLDNQRHIGAVEWRQKPQTFDAVVADWTTQDEKGRAYLAYFAQANRVFEKDSPTGTVRLDAPVANLSYAWPFGKLVGYWYYMDARDVQTFSTAGQTAGLSTSTVGGRFSGSTRAGSERAKASYTVEFANQRDIGNNPFKVDQNYILGELAWGIPEVKVLAGYEVLGGSGQTGDKFTALYSTLFKFNGWADKFLVTPDTGLRDFYLRLTGTVEKIGWYAAYHDFQADTGGSNYGGEVNLRLTRPIGEHTSVGLQYANYAAKDFAADTQKFWLWVGVKF